jgi:hypothetical protein
VARQFLPILIDGQGFDLGPAEIDADSDPFGHAAASLL